MRTLVLILVPTLFIVGTYLIIASQPQPKPVAITIPDSRISNLELKVKNLENWAQRQGMKY